MLIDEFTPAYDVSEYHRIIIHAPAEPVYKSVRSLDMSGSRAIRTLFRLRGMPASCLSFDGLLRSGFVLLGERPDEEILLGLVGRFWSPRGDLQKLDVESFRVFDQAGYAKATWNFSLKERSLGVTELSTETRVECLDQRSRRRFLLYWRVIGPFSGLIRREFLRTIKREVERQTNCT